MNKAILIGVVCDPPRNRITDNGFRLLNCNVKTVDEYMTRAGEIKHRDAYHRVTAWGSLAELREGLNEGDMISVEGRLHTRKYRDKDNHEQRITEIIANAIEIIVASGSERQQPQPETPSEHELMDDEDIPF